jgi:hypothetical protein
VAKLGIYRENPMNFILWSIALAAILAAAIQLFVVFRLYTLRHLRLYPQPGQATLTDVVRLQKAGMSVWAIRCYREIYHCSLRQAKEAVKNISTK